MRALFVRGGFQPGFVVPLIVSFCLALVAPVMSLGLGLVEAEPLQQGAAPTYQVANVQVIPASEDRLLRLAPDGSAFVVERSRRPLTLCIVDAPTMTDQFCVNLEEAGVRSFDLASVQWSPDSTRVVFGEDPLRTFFDGDLWLLDARTGNVTNLTDDGHDRRLDLTSNAFDPLSESDVVYLDVVPAWSPNGDEIVFSRTPVTNAGWGGTRLERLKIPDDGSPPGDPERVGLISPTGQTTVYLPIRWSADGRSIIFTVAYPQPDDPRNGLWMVAVDGGSVPRQIAREIRPGRGYAILVDVRGDPDVVLVTDFTAFRNPQAMTDPEFLYLVDVETGVKRALTIHPDDALNSYAAVVYAALSPDGRAVLQIGNEGARHPVTIRDLATGNVTILDLPLEMDQRILPTTEQFGVDWVDSNQLFLPFGPSKGGLLVTLAS